MEGAAGVAAAAAAAKRVRRGLFPLFLLRHRSAFSFPRLNLVTNQTDKVLPGERRQVRQKMLGLLRIHGLFFFLSVELNSVSRLL